MANLQDLQKLGLLTEGQEIILKRKSGLETILATIGKNGTIVLSDGRVFRTPTSAAKELNGGMSVNGWKAWRLKSNGKYLSDLRPAKVVD
jgi:hypothetical protein